MSNNQSLKVNPARNAPAAKAKKEEAKTLLDHFLQYLKPKYLSGQNSIARNQTSFGFTPSKNAGLNWGALLGTPYDPAIRVRPGDPLTELRKTTDKVGLGERVYNNNYQPRVPLAN